MSKNVTIDGTIYKIPEYGENKWGENTTALLEAMAESLSNAVGPQDILTKEAILTNNRTTPAAIVGFKFNSAIVQNIECYGVIVRIFTTLSGKTPKSDTFSIVGSCVESTVKPHIKYAGDRAGVYLTVGNDGQVSYTSDDDSDTESLTIKFYGKAIVDETI